MSPNPLVVLISDIHFSVNALELASKSLRHALNTAEQLGVPLIIAGDLNDSKAIIRGEVANELIEILSRRLTEVYIIVGNHDLLNERGVQHGLNFLRPFATIVDELCFINVSGQEVYLLPYQNDNEALKGRLNLINSGSLLIMHQGFLGANMGEYVQDKTSISTSLVKDFRVFSGHYHRHQTLDTVTYIGSPYTTSFAEAMDGPKGYLVINTDRSFEQVKLPLRKHIIKEICIDPFMNYNYDHLMDDITESDLLWIKARGMKSILDNVNKENISIGYLKGRLNFKYEKQPFTFEKSSEKQSVYTQISPGDTLDLLIDNLTDTEDHKVMLKNLWRSIIK